MIRTSSRRTFLCPKTTAQRAISPACGCPPCPWRQPTAPKLISRSLPAAPWSTFTRWDAIPGARGCTPQSCSFRDHFAQLKSLGVARLFGLSTQDTEYQREAVDRLHLPFAILSDAGLRFARALRLPTFEVAGMTLLKRMVLIIDDGVIAKAFYPVFPPDESAAVVVEWLRSSR